MRPTLLFIALALAFCAGCATNPDAAALGASAPLVIDQPVSPFPYNSRFW